MILIVLGFYGFSPCLIYVLAYLASLNIHGFLWFSLFFFGGGGVLVFLKKQFMLTDCFLAESADPYGRRRVRTNLVSST